ncbi:MAG: deoxyribose-phosphate aldolase [Lachnospiraceae bacterium]|jgi:deoxyribose-phosphate aldolase
MVDIQKLIADITDEIYNKVSSDTSFVSAAPAAANQNLAKYIDHTLLKAVATPDDITKLCEEAKANGFASVCVNTCYVAQAAKLLANSSVKTCCVVGFPLGAMSIESKTQEAINAIKDGANEVDMVVNVGMIKAGNWQYVKQDIESIAMACRGKALLKVIIETCLLTDEEKVKVCTVSKLAGADFVKTSTGFSTGGATVEDVRLMRQTVGPDMGVKASGGVKTYADAVAMIEAGASRIGTSNGCTIVQGTTKADTSGHICVGCGNCKKATACPSGKVDIVIANNY